MTVFHTLLLLLAAGTQPTVAPDQPFTLAPGDFRWVPFAVRQTPTEVDCRFQVVKGNASVHVELLPMSEFRLFSRGREHETMAITATAREGEFRRVIDSEGRYAVVVINDRNATPAVVSFRFETTLNPGPGDVGRTLSPGLQFAVVAISLGFFLAAFTWSGHRLIQAMRRHRREI